jgi:hypothetical protein
MSLDALWPASWPLPPATWHGALAALAAAFAWAGLLRLAGRRDLAALGAGLGVAAGWALTLGVPVASPRQLAERLPLLALAASAASLPLALVATRRALGLALGAALLLGAGAWWLAGAPTTAADLRRALAPLVTVGGLAALAALELRSPLRVAAAFAFLLAAVLIAPPPGPWPILAALGVTAALGSWPAGGAWTAAPALPLALALTGLAAGPLLARGAASDWTASTAPFAAVALGPALATRIGGGGRAGPAVGWAVAGGFPLLITWLLARNP